MSDGDGDGDGDGAKAGWNPGLWLAPPLAIVGFLSYYLFFARWALFRDHPWANLLILAAALGWAIAATRRAWPSGGFARVGGVLGIFVSAALLGMLLFYSYSLSYQLPSADLAAGEGQPIPSIALAAHDGSSFDLGAKRDDGLVLVFYRGYW